MTDTNSITLRNALAAAVKNHVESNNLTAKDAAATVGVQLSRFYQVLRGEVSKISSDALVNMLGGLGYRLTAINGSGEGTEIVLSLDKYEFSDDPGEPMYTKAAEACEDAMKVDGMKIVAADGSWEASKGGPFRVVDGQVEVDPDAGRVVNDDE